LTKVNRVVLVFLKYPERGRVKTRLARDVGEAEAVRIYEVLVKRVLEVVGGVKGADVRIVFDPEERGEEVRRWVGEMAGEKGAGWTFHAQGRGDLGARMRGAFGEAMGAGYGKVLAVGTDCVDVTVSLFEEAWRMLETVGVVFGPALDGGYYLMGMKRVYDGLFEGIEWSGSETLEMSLKAAADAGASVGMLRPLRDVDDLEDWEAVEGTRGFE
jgi:rSAM/selenodomain-associated transferase 1